MTLGSELDAAPAAVPGGANSTRSGSPDRSGTGARRGLQRGLRPGGLGGRSVAGVASQLVYGLSNFVLLATIAATSSDALVGAASIVYLQVLLWQSIARGLTGDALLMRSASLDRADRRAVLGGSLQVAALVAVPALLATSAIGSVTMDAVTGLVFAVSVVPVILHDTSRLGLIAIDRPARALVGDSTWLAVQVVAMVALALAGRLGVDTAVAAWGLGAFAGAAVNTLALRPALRPRSLRLFIDRTAGTRSSLVASNALAFLSRNVTYYLIGIVGGLATLGLVRRGLVPFAALTATFLGLVAVVTPALARAPESIPRVTRRFAFGCGVGAALWGVFVVTVSAAHVSWVQRVIGDDTAVIAWIAVALVAQGVAAAAIAGLRAGGWPRDNAWGVAAGLVVMVAIVWPMTGRFGATGGAAALAVGNAVEAACLSLALAHQLRRRATTHPWPSAVGTRG